MTTAYLQQLWDPHRLLSHEEWSLLLRHSPPSSVPKERREKKKKKIKFSLSMP
jgi:hypothetical protein